MAKRVMIVDDSMRWRMELRDVLATHGYSVVAEASSGRKALEMFERIDPDIVMVDATMPDMDGVCTIRELRNKSSDVLLILCAGNGERATVTEAMSVGAADFCVKPYVPRSVVSILRRATCGVMR